MLETYHTQAKRKLAATVVSLIIIAGIVVYVDHSGSLRSANTSGTAQTAASTSTTAPSSSGSSSGSSDSSSSSSSSGSSSNSSTSSGSSSYKDGSYSATADYYVPHGDESIQVMVKLQNGVITDASIQNSEGDPESARFQEDFAASYKSYVVGKSISSLQLGVISGASDTTQGFEDALSQIASKAQS